MKTKIFLIVAIATLLLNSCKKDEVEPKNSTQNVTGSTPMKLVIDSVYKAPAWGYVDVTLEDCSGITFRNYTQLNVIVTSSDRGIYLVAPGDEYELKINCYETSISAYYFPI